MADNVTLPGAGLPIATNEIGGNHYQKIKLVSAVDGETTPVTSAAPLPVAAYGELIEATEAMRMALQALTHTIGMVLPDTAGRQRVVVDAITGSLTLSTVTSVNTVSSVTGQTNMGGYAANDQIPALMRMSADALRRNIVVS